MGSLWTKFRMRLRRLRVRWRRFSTSRWGKRIQGAARQMLTVGIIGYLVYRMSLIGWGNIWDSLPRTPWFYVIFGAFYLCLPFFQALIFGTIWSQRLWKLFPASLKKRVYNKDVLSYSGDVYLYFWGRRNLDLPARKVLHHIKDNAIVSSVASTFVGFGLLALFLFSGYIALPDFIARHEVAYSIGAVAVAVGGGIAAINFRQTVFLLPSRLLLTIFGLHLVRLFVTQGLHVLEWNVVIPEVDLQVWCTFLAVQIITTRIPLLPSRDLIFLAAGIELAGIVQVPKAAIAGLLGVHSVLDKSLNLLLFAAVSLWDRESMDGMPAPEDEEKVADSAVQESASRASVTETSSTEPPAS